jgi:MFS family permease
MNPVRTLFVIQLVAMGAMEMSGPFWPVHLRTLAASDASFAFASVAVYVAPMAGVMLTGRFWGRVGDRHGHKPMMLRALLALSLTQLALAWTSDVWAVLALRFAQGACAGFIAPAQAYGVSIEPPARRARLFAFLQVATNVGSLAGALAGGLILDHAGFFWINVSASAICALCAVAAAFALPGVGPAAAAPPRAADGQPRPGALAVPVTGLLAVIGLLLASRMITQAPLSLYLPRVFGTDHWVTGLCQGVMALGFVASAGRWARHFEGRPALPVLRQVAVVAALCAVLTALAGLTRHAPLFVAIYFAWGTLLGATTPVLMALVSAATARERQGRVLGLAQACNQFASMAGIALGMGLTHALGVERTYFFVAAAYALATLFIVALWRGRTARGELEARA